MTSQRSWVDEAMIDWADTSRASLGKGGGTATRRGRSKKAEEPTFMVQRTGGGYSFVATAPLVTKLLRSASSSPTRSPKVRNFEVVESHTEDSLNVYAWWQTPSWHL